MINLTFKEEGKNVIAYNDVNVLFRIYPDHSCFSNMPCFKIEPLAYPYPMEMDELDDRLSQYLNKCFNTIEDAKYGVNRVYELYCSLLFK